MKETKNSLKDTLIKKLEKRKVSLNNTLKKDTEEYQKNKSETLTKIEVIDLQLQGLKKTK